MQDATPPGYRGYPSAHMRNQSNDGPQGYHTNYPSNNIQKPHQLPNYNNGEPNYSHTSATGNLYVNNPNLNINLQPHTSANQVDGYNYGTTRTLHVNPSTQYPPTYPQHNQPNYGQQPYHGYRQPFQPVGSSPSKTNPNYETTYPGAMNHQIPPPGSMRQGATNSSEFPVYENESNMQDGYIKSNDKSYHPKETIPIHRYYNRESITPEPAPSPPREQTDESENYTPPFIKRLTETTSKDKDPIQVPRPHHPGPNIEKLYSSEKVIDVDYYSPAPPSNSIYTFVDKGSSSIRFTRLTLASCPGLIGHQFSTNIPFGCVIQPFADQNQEEMPVPVVDLTSASLSSPSPGKSDEMGPVRCQRCKAYINPFMMYERAKSVLVCNLCGYHFKVPDFYLPMLDNGQNRVDKSARAELSYGSVDFVASQAYSAAVPKPPRFCIIIENTFAARYMNLTNCVINAVQQVLPQINSPYFELSIITYDESIQFYTLDLSKDTPQWKLLVVSDVDAPFIPAPVDNLFVNVTENLEDINNLLNSIPSFTSEKTSSHSAGNAALMVALRLISHSGTGLINWFCCSVPDIGMGALKVDPKAKEKLTPELLNPNFYDSVLHICYTKGISIDIHCYPTKNTTLNLYSLSYPAIESGGRVYYTKDFIWDKDYDKLYYDLLRSLQKPTGFDCTVKIRTAKGLSVNKLSTVYTNPRSMTDVTSFKVPKLDADSGFAIEVKIEESMSDVGLVYLQVACLYTTMMGTKQIRVHTLAIRVSNAIQMLFRHSDLDSLVNYLARLACSEVLKGKTNWKENLNTIVTDILHSYRSNIPQKPSPEQLFLPDTLKLLPLYYSCLIRNVACQQYKSLSDEQIWYLYNFLSTPTMYTLPMLYPRIFPIHRSFTKRSKEIENLPKIGEYSPALDLYYLPESIPARGDEITTDGVYIFDVANIIILYVGNDVSPDYISKLFGPEAAANDKPTSEWKIIDSDPNSQGALINRLIKQIQSERRSFSYPIVRMILPRTNQEESLRKYLVEDNSTGYSGYIDLLGEFHKAIIHKMQNY